jgi:FtsZ-binding cell division protein ZapB
MRIDPKEAIDTYVDLRREVRNLIDENNSLKNEIDKRDAEIRRLRRFVLCVRVEIDNLQDLGTV